jgi:hypothetical protein
VGVQVPLRAPNKFNRIIQLCERATKRVGFFASKIAGNQFENHLFPGVHRRENPLKGEGVSGNLFGNHLVSRYCLLLLRVEPFESSFEVAWGEVHIVPSLLWSCAHQYLQCFQVDSCHDTARRERVPESVPSDALNPASSHATSNDSLGSLMAVCCLL